jgi:hypothetical protein
MGKVPLDLGTADRMLAGEVDPADVPPGFEAVAELLVVVRAAARRPVFAPIAGPVVVDARRAAGQSRGRRSMLAPTPFKPRLSILAAAVALSAMTGAAFAAGLPGAASARAAALLQELGIATPGSPAHAPAARPQAHGSTVSQTATTTSLTGADKGALIAGIASGGRSHAGESAATVHAKSRSKAPGHGKGAEISTLAHTTTATGAAKGATISAAASGGKSHAGQHGHRGHTPAGAGHGQGGGHHHR